MNREMKLCIGATCALMALPVALPATAYIGPGAGLSLVGALWAVVAAVGAALFFVLAWPLRRMLRRRRAQQLDEHADMVGAADGQPATARPRPHDRR